ncbi:SLC13 family permease [Vibrio lamellibrachiae]|uniref:SLC13 family permease n=1 Tax=Vibrio lamellibrachiae TaxID=2910253 RepID=UPI003D152877
MLLSISPAVIVVGIFLLTIAGLIKFQSHPERVFGSVLLALYTLGFVSTEQVINSFSNQGLLTLVLLMICSFALEKTKLLRAIAQYVIRPDYTSTWLRLFGLTALSSAFLNNTAVVSTMLAPIRNNIHHPASKLLLPLSYAAIFGGTLTLVGTSTNLIINSMVIESGLPSIGFFDFTVVGLSIVAVCGSGLFILSRFLPVNSQGANQTTDYFIDAKVQPKSSLIGQNIEQNGLRNLESLFLVEILRKGRLISPVSPQELIEENDRLIFSGDIKKVTLLSQFDGIKLFAHENGLPINNLTEVIIKPESVLVGQTLKRVGFRALFDAAVVAIRRDGEAISGKLGDVDLRSGDFLVLAVGEDFKTRHNINKNFYLISGVKTEQTLTALQEKFSIGGFALAVGLAAFGIVPLFKGMLLLLGILLFTGCLNSNEVLQRMPKQIWLIIASALLLSHALTNSGALENLSNVIQLRQDIFTPLFGLLLVYILTWLMTELVTNNAAAALVFPIAYSLAESLSVNPMAYIFAVAFGASASFISPYGYQTNLMVFNAGQYRIKDFLKIGMPISVLYGTTVVSAIYLFIGL